mmetsp:Transcript_10806/g.22457  ORF Transcript_10806/g.22457 Transcript_10806/m.22457 type:complete len:549 (+) Transcript_10806:200-1846(+)
MFRRKRTPPSQEERAQRHHQQQHQQPAAPQPHHPHAQSATNPHHFPPGALLANGRYRVRRLLNRGGSAVVYEADDVTPSAAVESTSSPSASPSSLVALKCHDLTQCDPRALDRLKREILNAKDFLQHENVVRLLNVALQHDCLVLALELVDGADLLEVINRGGGRLGEARARHYFVQLLRGVAHLHQSNLCHRDLKPENFLFSCEEEDSELKVTDFGLSTFYRHGQRFTEVVGSAYYIAPEVLQRGYGPPCDIWSIGVIMYIVLCGRPPFFGRTESAVFNNIMKAKARLEENFKRDPWPKITKEAKDLIRKMLNMDPQARITASQALAHDWIRKDGVAPDIPLDVNVVQSLKDFTGYSKIKQLALRHVAQTYSDEEIRDIRDQFALMDKDGTGTLSLDEMIEALQNMQLGADENKRNAIGEDEIKEIVKAMDYDGDGEIDYMEFVTAALHITQQQRGDKDAWLGRVRTAFDKIDADGNGYIDLKELESELAASGETPEAIQELIKEHDANGDGLIDFNEFSAILRNRASSRTRSRSRGSRGSSGKGKK